MGSTWETCLDNRQTQMNTKLFILCLVLIAQMMITVVDAKGKGGRKMMTRRAKSTEKERKHEIVVYKYQCSYTHARLQMCKNMKKRLVDHGCVKPGEVIPNIK